MNKVKQTGSDLAEKAKQLTAVRNQDGRWSPRHWRRSPHRSHSPDKSSGESFARPLQSLIQTSHKVHMSQFAALNETIDTLLPNTKDLGYFFPC